MERYAPTIKDLAPRDIVARCMVQEIREGRGAGPNKDYVYLDITHLAAPRCIDAKLPDITEFARTYLGVEPYTEPVPVHADRALRDGRHPDQRQGRGALRDNDTVVPGLYAAGECACVSVHGSNRLGTNSLLDINVFGKRAGNNAVEYVKTADFVPLPEDPADGRPRAARAAPRLDRHRAHRRAPQGAAGLDGPQRPGVPHRRDAGRGHRGDRRGCASATRTSRCRTRASASTPTCSRRSSSASCSTSPRSSSTRRRNRKESRGGHFREDFPKRDDENCMEHTMAYLDGRRALRRRGDHIRLDTKPVVITSYQPMERKY